MNVLNQDNIVTINESNAQPLLIEESQKRLVLAYFWTEKHPASLQLMPIIEKICLEYNGDFLLAKINVAEQTTIARQLGVESLPTAMFIKDGRPIDGFAGLQAENKVRELLDKYLPKPWDKLLFQAETLMEEKQFPEALVLLRQAHHDSTQRIDIGFHLAHVYLELNRLDEAEALLKNTPLAEQNTFYQQLISQMHLKRTAAVTPEIATLELALMSDPNNLEIKMQLAIQYQQENQARKALESLLSILKIDKNYNDGEAKKIMLDIFKSIGNKDPLVTEFQRQLFSLLY